MAYYERDTDRTWIAKAGVVALLGLMVAGGIWLVGADDGNDASVDISAPNTAQGSASTTTTAPSETTDGTSISQAGPVQTAASTTAASVSSTSVVVDEATTTTVDAPEVQTTLVEPSSTTVGAGDAPGYPTSPDGTPLPIVAIFDTDTITVTGQIPSEAARERLAGLAVANSQTPAVVVDNMVVNPNVPTSVGVRVLELNSVRFPEASAKILPEHALELDRAANIMNALPNISVLVIGHADQRGDDARNFAISDERARAVVNYLRFLGISPTRLASRAAGETELLALGEDDVSLELNRRTEFVFYGLLAD